MTEDAGFGIYVHWPFCESKCPYCDFNSHVAKNTIDQKSFWEAYEREIVYMAEIQKTKPTSIFFGGGTPSLMKPQTVDYILRAIDREWGIGDIEITLEANPSSVEAGRFAGYRTAGVNRISIGVQSLDDQQLKSLGRLHTAQDAINAIGIAKGIFGRISIDLIYARPNQTTDEWKAELEQAIQLADDHLSLYQLTIEPNTPFYDLHKKGKLDVPNSEQAAILYELTGEITEAHGFEAYEVSNYAKPGNQSIHNLTYWKSGTWAGIGPGAHSRLNGRLNAEHGRIGIVNVRNPEEWKKQVEQKGNGIQDVEQLTQQQITDELLVMGIRLKEGINVKQYEQVSGRELNQTKLKELKEEGLIEVSGGNLKATKKGRMVLNAIIAEIE